MERLTVIRHLSVQDLDAVLAVQAASPEAAQWSRKDYARGCAEAAPRLRDVHGWVAEVGGKVVGFVLSHRVADEVEVLNLGVAPGWRRAGIGTRLIEQALGEEHRAGARSAFLEVRESNCAAIAFYRRQGFRQTGRRSRYYSEPVEDALVFVRQPL